ncbi:DUF2742 domain-containing protein [Tsukamurella sp. DT100]|uniref:DUF2742 domain-containing protein n=1 Tax=Tsukamurella sp. DT100 TaxID=3393415 RepID=UPI003CF12D08
MTEKITVESIRAWAVENNLLPTPGSARTGSREVSFSAALDFLAPFLAACPTTPPPAFTPQWQDEPDGQLQFVAVLIAAVLWALHQDARQAAAETASTAAAEAISDTTPSPASSARYVADDAAQPPFDYPPRRAA